MISWEQRAEIEDFLYREARLLDQHLYHEWLDLFTDDAVYHMPLREATEGDVPPAGHAVINDRKWTLEARVRKEDTGLANVEIPQSITTHLISNVIVDEGAGIDEFSVHSNFIVRQARKLRDEAWWTGSRTDVVRRVNGAYKIARREIILDLPILPRGITIFF